MGSNFDCVVIGAGVAGMTAAIYLKRYNISVLLIEKSSPGGQITQTPKVENYPGCVSIDGATLAMNMFEQVNNLNVEYRYGNVTKIEDSGSEKKVYLGDEVIQTKSIILATGRVPRKLGLEKENQLVGRGISWCATCDGVFYKNEEVAVVGGGNSALEESLFLSTICKKVHILYRGQNLRADHILQDRAKEKENIEIHYFTQVKELIEKEEKLSSIIVIEREEQKEIDAKCLFIDIGFTPDEQLLSTLDLELEDSYIIVDDQMKTNLDGIYACGDAIKKDLYQVSTAVGEGSLAAYSIKKYLLGLDDIK